MYDERLNNNARQLGITEISYYSYRNNHPGQFCCADMHPAAVLPKTERLVHHTLHSLRTVALSPCLSPPHATWWHLMHCACTGLHPR